MLQRLPVKAWITVQEETLLSYLCGLSPAGEEVYVKMPQLLSDLQDIVTSNGCMMNRLLTGLVVAGAIQRVRHHRSHYIVLKRPEEFRSVNTFCNGKRAFHSIVLGAYQ